MANWKVNIGKHLKFKEERSIIFCLSYINKLEMVVSVLRTMVKSHGRHNNKKMEVVVAQTKAIRVL